MEQLQVVIAGAGIMGASLAQVYALAGHSVFLWNRSQSGLDRAREVMAVNQEVMVRQGLESADAVEAAAGRITFTTDRSCMDRCGLLLECIVEDLEQKQAFWREASRQVPAESLLATNTSGLSITRIAQAVERPERFMGQHWLNPPHILPLCEIIRGEKTQEAFVERMYRLVQDLGKKPVVVKREVSGFLINRLQYALLREALYLVESGAASVEDIDTVFRAGLGLRYAALGPFRVCDLGGLDTFDRVNRYLNADLADNKEGDPYLAELVRQGRCGVKTGAGFYDYPGDEAMEAIRQRDQRYIALAKVLYGTGHGEK